MQANSINVTPSYHMVCLFTIMDRSMDLNSLRNLDLQEINLNDQRDPTSFAFSYKHPIRLLRKILLEKQRPACCQVIIELYEFCFALIGLSRSLTCLT